MYWRIIVDTANKYNYIAELFSKINWIPMGCSFFIGWIAVVLLLRLFLSDYGQSTAVLTGYVVDATMGKPMPFANVYVNGSTRGLLLGQRGGMNRKRLEFGRRQTPIFTATKRYKSCRKWRFERVNTKKDRRIFNSAVCIMRPMPFLYSTTNRPFSKIFTQWFRGDWRAWLLNGKGPCRRVAIRNGATVR